MSSVLLNTAHLAGHRHPAMAESLRQAGQNYVAANSTTAAAPPAAKVDWVASLERCYDLRSVGTPTERSCKLLKCCREMQINAVSEADN